MEAGAEVEHACDDGITPLIRSIMEEHEAAVAVLLQAGANVEHASPTDGGTPLFVSAATGNAAVLAALLEAGAMVDFFDE